MTPASLAQTIPATSALGHGVARGLSRRALGIVARLVVCCALLSAGLSRPAHADILRDIVVNGSAGWGDSIGIGDHVRLVLAVPPEPMDEAIHNVEIALAVPRGFSQAQLSLVDAKHADQTTIRNASGQLRALIRSIKPRQQLLFYLEGRIENLSTSTTGKIYEFLPRLRMQTGRSKARKWRDLKPTILQLVDPVVAVNKTLLPSGAFDGGDEIRVRLRVANVGGRRVAYDLAIRDHIPDKLSLIRDSLTVTTKPDGLLGSRVVDWLDRDGITIDRGRDGNALHLKAGQAIDISYRARLARDVLPDESLQLPLMAQWSSQPGPHPYERTGSRQPSWNDYRAVSSPPAKVRGIAHLRAKLGATELPGGGYRIGDAVAITTEARLVEGITEGLSIVAVLPHGMQYEATQSLHIPGPSRSLRVHALPQSPTRGDKGRLVWALPKIKNQADNDPENDILRMVFRARITSEVLTNKKGVALINLEGAGQTIPLQSMLGLLPTDTEQTALRSSVPKILVHQPRVELTLIDASGASFGSRPEMVGAGDAREVWLRLRNVGTGPAYGVSAQLRLPQGMRSRPPKILLDHTKLAGAATRLQEDKQKFNQDGLASWLFDPTMALPAGEEAVLALRVWVDGDIGAGRTLVPDARVTGYSSLPFRNPKQRKGLSHRYQPGPVQSLSFQLPRPREIALDVTVAGKETADGEVFRATIGDVVQHRILAPLEPVAAALYNIVVEQHIASGLVVDTEQIEVYAHGGTKQTNRKNLPGRLEVLPDRLRIHLPFLAAREQLELRIPTRVANQESVGVTARINQISPKSARFRWTSAPQGVSAGRAADAGARRTTADGKWAVTRPITCAIIGNRASLVIRIQFVRTA